VSWGAYSTYATDAPFRVSHAGGVSEFRVNQKASPLNWRLLGRFQMDPAQGHKVTMSDDADGWVAADAVNFVPAGAAVDTATWSLTIGQRDYYDVAARWPASWPNSAYAYYTLHHDGGASETVHDQNINGGAWMTLGTVVLDPAGNPRVTLDDRAQWDGDPADLAADAVRYVPSATALRDAVWPVSVSSSGQYRVYAGWPARGIPGTVYSFPVASDGTGLVGWGHGEIGAGRRPRPAASRHPARQPAARDLLRRSGLRHLPPVAGGL
jgi:hypothetical protein